MLVGHLCTWAPLLASAEPSVCCPGPLLPMPWAGLTRALPTCLPPAFHLQEKFRLEADLKLCEMRQLVMAQELSLLRDFDKRETVLIQKRQAKLDDRNVSAELTGLD